MWLPDEWEKHDVTNVHNRPAWMFISLMRKLRTMNWYNDGSRNRWYEARAYSQRR